MAETRLRTWLTHSWNGLPWGDAHLQSALELTSHFSSHTGTSLGLIGGVPSATSRPFEIADLTWEPHSGGSRTRARVERLDLAWSLGMLDVQVGRQPVSFGTSHFVGVLDVLAPFAPGWLDASFKPGIDALRVRTSVGESGEAEVILAGAAPFGEGAAIARMRASLAGTDVELLGGRFRDRGFGGLGWEGELGPAGLWGELAAFQRRPDVETYRGGWSEAALAAVLGADFNLPLEARGGIALFLNDFGARRPQDLAAVYADAPFREGWVFLGSSRYAILTASRALHPLVSGTLAGLVNLVDGSTLWQPRLTLSVSDDADLGAYAWLGTGARPQTDGSRLEVHSEFGMMPTGLGLYARWYF